MSANKGSDGDEMIYACDACYFLFESDQPVRQCPDCGKFKVREATEQEIAEYRSRQEDLDRE